MIQSVTLSPAEALLLKIEEERHRSVMRDSAQKLELAVQSIYQAHGWPWGVLKGQMQRDPLDQTVVRFVYDDGQPAPVEVVTNGGVTTTFVAPPELKIVPLEKQG